MSIRSGKFITVMLAATLLIAPALSGCRTADSSAAALSAGTNTAATAVPIDPGYSDRDLAGTWDPEDATRISLNGSALAVSGPGATASQGILTITAAGVYVLSGTLNNGQIIVDAADSDKVQLVLKNASIACADNAPIYVKGADKVFLTLAGGTQNTVIDGAAYANAEDGDEPDAAIFSKSDLTINGDGALTVTAQYNNGIASKDDLVITGGTVTVTAVNDALRGRDAVAIHNGAFVINAARGDGIKSNNDEDAEKGWISIDGGTFDITAGNDGIQAERVLQINDGKITVKTGGGSAGASTEGRDKAPPEWGKRGGEVNTTAAADGEDGPESSDSAKGVKAGTALHVNGGHIDIDSRDDALHSNGDVVITAGTLTVASGDDGIHADASLVVAGGDIDITQSYEGLEGNTITITGGNLHITARDDGLNAAGGNDGSAPGDSAFIRITGGHVAINASGDGIDSNGALYVDGGTVLVNGPTNNGNGSLDYNRVAEITEGTLVAAGSSGMAQNFSASSSQNTLLVAYSSVQRAGTPVTLQDGKGKAILTFVPAKDYQSILISTPKLEQGETYTLYSGGTAKGEQNDGLYTGGNYAAGTKVVSFTLSEAATGITDQGERINGMGGPGGMGRPGGGPGMGRPGGPGW